MNTQLINKIEKSHLRTDLPNFKVGDTVTVSTIIREGDKQRIQKFKGLVISIKGSGTRKMFTVRKISYGVGVEKMFPLYSPNIESIEVDKHGKVRRAKLYYLRDRVGKLALKVKPGQPAPVIEHADEAQEVLEQQEQSAEPTTSSDVEADTDSADETSNEVDASEDESTDTEESTDSETEEAEEKPAE